jgi:hypothetical protein
MRLPRLSSRPCVFLFLIPILVLCGASVSAQEKSGPPDRSASSPVKKSANAKRQTPPASTADSSGEAGTESDLERADDAEQILKREEWFYRQRTSADGHIPAGARLKAFQHLQRMMEAEGKLVRHADGTYSAAPALTAQALTTPQWAAIGPAPTLGGFYTPTTGRVTTIAVDPSDATGNTVLIGAAQGGIWLSSDAGQTWTSVGDQNPSLAMGSIAFANPASPGGAGVVYAGTGEQASIGFDVYFGAGVLKSTNGGVSWTQTCTVAGPKCPFIGPYSNFTFGFYSDGGAHISYVAVNPSNPNLVLVSAQVAQNGVDERLGGVYCSDDGGGTWNSVPTASGEMATFVGFASATTAYAALGRTSGSFIGIANTNPNGIYKSTNADGKGSAGTLTPSCGNITFSNVTANGVAGVPVSSIGRIDLGIASADSTGNTVYASIADASINPLTGSRASQSNLGVFKTIDGGTTWTNTNAPDVCSPQCWYDNVIKVDPTNSQIVFFGGGAHEVFSPPSVTFEWIIHSNDGGTTWSPAIPTAPSGTSGLPHVDEHAMAFVKIGSTVRMYLGNDGGVWRTDDAEASTVTWTNLNNLPLQITQFYPSLSIHPSDPGIAFGGAQDNGSQNYNGNPIWTNNNACGDGGWTLIDPAIPSTVYTLCQLIQLQKSVTNGTPHSFRLARTGISLFDPVNFIAPMAIDAANPNRLYFGTTKVYQTVDGAASWQVLNGGAALLNTNAVVVALAVGGGNNGNVVYAATSPDFTFNPPGPSGVFVSSNVAAGSASFSPVGQNQLPPRQPTQVVIDPSDATGNTAYITYSGFTGFNGDLRGHIFKTTTGGTTWIDVSCAATTTDCSKPALATGDMPNIPVNDLVIDPLVPGTLYAATDLGVLKGVCTVAGCTWTTLNNNSLPNVAVLSLKLHEPSRTLRAATHGRGVWDLLLGGVPAFAITSLSPISANAGDPGVPQFTVNGSGFTASSKIVFTINGTTTTITPASPTTPTQLIGVVPSTALQTPGVAQVSVIDNAQTTGTLPFPVLALSPTITSVVPNSTPVQIPIPTTPFTITIAGTSFTPGSKAIFNPFYSGAGGKINLATTFNSGNGQLTATIPSNFLGPFGSTNDISVSTPPPGGGLSAPRTFKILGPVPPNDNFANALDLAAISSPNIQDTSAATTETSDPVPPCGQLQGSVLSQLQFGIANSIWYKFTPAASGTLNLDVSGSSYLAWLSVWTGPSQATLTLFPNACSGAIVPFLLPAQLSNINLTGGTTYYVMVGSAGPVGPPIISLAPNPIVPNPIAFGGKSVLNFSFVVTPDFTMTPAAPTAVTVSAGSPATYTLAIGSTGGFSSNVSVTCSLPAAATTCAANPPSVAPGSNTTITVTTMAHQFLIPSRPFRRFGPRQKVVPLLLLAMLAAILLAFAARTRRQRIAISLPLAGLILFLVFQAAGCGGNTNSGPPPPHGTQPGTYTVTITGTSGGTTKTTTVTLTVN